MKYIFFVIIASIFTNCSNSNFVITPYLTDNEKIQKLKKNSTIQETNQTLGIQPNNVLLYQENILLCEYYYRIKERSINTYNKEKFNTRYTENQKNNEREDKSLNSELSQKFGASYLNDEQYKLYIYFKNDKLEKYITSDGLDKSLSIDYANSVTDLLEKDSLKYEFFEDNNCYVLNKDLFSLNDKSELISSNIIKSKESNIDSNLNENASNTLLEHEKLLKTDTLKLLSVKEYLGGGNTPKMFLDTNGVPKNTNPSLEKQSSNQNISVEIESKAKEYNDLSKSFVSEVNEEKTNGKKIKQSNDLITDQINNTKNKDISLTNENEFFDDEKKSEQFNNENIKLNNDLNIDQFNNVKNKEISSVSPYNKKEIFDDGIIPLNVEIEDRLLYRVQIGAYTKLYPITKFKSFSPISAEALENNLYRYLVGYFYSFDSAKEALQKIKSIGYPKSFIIAYQNKESISLSKAQSLEKNSIDKNIKSEDFEIFISENFDEVKTIPLASIDTLFFTVQVGVFSKPLTSEKFKSIGPLVKEVLPNGLLRYSSGILSTIEEAEKKRYQLLRSEFKHAFITAYYKGKKIPLNEARKILAKKNRTK